VPGRGSGAGNVRLGGVKPLPNLAKMRRMPSTLETALFARLIDHAPLFPPAQLPLDEALAEHRRAQESPDGWLVRRFVCPASLLPALDGEPPALSVVLDAEADLDDPRVEAIELPPDSQRLTMFRGEVYVEASPAALTRIIPLMAENDTRAKVRCGPTVPDVEELAAVVRACRDAGVPFKATAGLHHAVRRDGQHGFLNLIAAAIFGDEEAALAEEDTQAFGIGGEGFRWRERAASASDVERGRAFFVAFGSCSFAEPVDELRELGFLSG
jgi:hypothetical protein